MSEFYFTATLDNGRTLYLAPLTSRLIEQSGQGVADASGYFLFERCHSDTSARVEIIAQVVSEEAALRLREMLSME
jgi:hypothetical protein